MRIVITGGMGSGKSTITAYLRQELPDYEFFDMDACVKGLYDDEVTQMILTHTFGTCIKSEISDLVFADDNAKQRLYAIMNGAIIAKVKIAAVDLNVVFDMPLFFEMGGTQLFEPDCIICVTCSEETRIERIKARDGFSEEKIRSIIAQQMPVAEKAQLSDYVISTDGSRSDTIESVIMLMHVLEL